jgi:hypothetical protein
VIVAKLDRLTRSVKDLCELLERFERRDVALISVAESLDTGSAAGRLVINIMTAVSQWEREAIGERYSRCALAQAAQGQARGEPALWISLSRRQASLASGCCRAGCLGPSGRTTGASHTAPDRVAAKRAGVAYASRLALGGLNLSRGL